MRLVRAVTTRLAAVLALGAVMGWTAALPAQEEGPSPKKDELPELSKVTDGLTRQDGFVNLFVDEDKNKLVMEIPGRALNQDLLLTTSYSRGSYAGWQWNSQLVRLERMDNKLLIIEPNTFYKGDGHLQSVVERTYPDPVIATVPIIAQGGGGSVAIDAFSLFTDQSSAFTGRMGRASVEQLGKAKAFPKNAVVEIVFRGATGAEGIYYSLNQLPNNSYRPRQADQRVGYFLTAQVNFSKDEREADPFERVINRWQLEKADPGLKLSPPKEPLVFYIEDTVPVRYRRWVREGIESWNAAFEKVGYSDAIVVRQQTESNEFADLDPEDARYNFFRWIASGRAFAMGPSNVDPRTGQILDADIIFDESMVRFYIDDYALFLSLSMPDAKAMTPRMRHWLAHNPHQHPNWAKLQPELALRIQTDPELAASGVTPEQLFANELLGGINGQMRPHFCAIGAELSREMAFTSLAASYGAMAHLMETPDGALEVSVEDAETTPTEVASAEEKAAEDAKKAEEKAAARKSLLDEWPEEFIGPLVREIVAHEVGHTLGLRHNFKASSWKTYDEILNTTDADAATVGSVMDYNPFVLKADGSKPDVFITGTIGPYDFWAIEYGYAQAGSGGYEKNEELMLKKILDKVAEDGHDYATDEDVASPDPTIARFDLGKEPMDFVEARSALADRISENLRDIVLQDDDPYSKAREAYMVLLGTRFSTAYTAAAHLGGHYLRRDQVGDPNARPPIEVVPAATQRRAMDLITREVFSPDSFEIDSELQKYLAASRWNHRGSSDWIEPLIFPAQDIVLRYQNNLLFELTNPERIQWLYDSEANTTEEDIFSVPEMFDGLTASIWQEVLTADDVPSTASVRTPMVSNLRRNLQRAYLSRLITIATSGEDSIYPAVARTLAFSELKTLGDGIKPLLRKHEDELDPYTLAHLQESESRITSALNVMFTVGEGSGGGGSIIFLLGQEAGAQPKPLSPGATYHGSPFGVEGGSVLQRTPYAAPRY